METPKLNIQFDYITISFANSKFTIGRNGHKASGDMPMDTFKKLSNYFKENTTEDLLTTTNSLINNKPLLNQIYPNWNIKDIHNFKIGDLISIDYKNQIHTGTIESIRGSNAKCKFNTMGNVTVPLSMIIK